MRCSVCRAPSTYDPCLRCDPGEVPTIPPRIGTVNPLEVVVAGRIYQGSMVPMRNDTLLVVRGPLGSKRPAQRSYSFGRKTWLGAPLTSTRFWTAAHELLEQVKSSPSAAHGSHVDGASAGSTTGVSFRSPVPTSHEGCGEAPSTGGPAHLGRGDVMASMSASVQLNLHIADRDPEIRPFVKGELVYLTVADEGCSFTLAGRREDIDALLSSMSVAVYEAGRVDEGP